MKNNTQSLAKMFAFLLFLIATATAQTYVITGSDTEFTATKGGETVGTANSAIQTVINAIKADAAGADCTIQFGNGTSELDIGTANINFNASGTPTWGKITLLGKITSANTSSNGAIYLSNGASVDSRADIKNTYSSGRAISNNGTGTLTISSGAISANSYAVYNSSSGAITISGGNISVTGTSSSTYAVYNSSSGAINISGGNIFATGTGSSTYAVYNSSSGGTVVLSGSPDITGRIRMSAAEKLSVSAFSPSTRIYALEFSSYSVDMIAVKDGAAFSSNFTIANQPESDLSLVAADGDLVVKVVNGYHVSASGNSYTIARSTGGYITVQEAINYIKTEASGADCTIQFGNSTSELDIGTGNITFSSSGTPNWGKITLLGKITSASTSSNGAIYLSGNASVDSKADIKNTYSSGYAIRNSGTGTLTISSGTISANSYAAYNSSSGIINISGGTISATGSSGYAVYNSSSGAINISGGTISTGGTYAVYNNNANGTVVLSGSPNITGRIRMSAAEKLSVESFIPGTKTYAIEYSSYSNDMIVVKDGATFSSNFTIANPPSGGSDLSLVASNGDVVVRVVNGYHVSTSGNSYTIIRGTGGYITVQQAIDYIKTEANGEDCSIQFGNGTDELDIGAAYINFSGTGWGKITLLGKITSSNTGAYPVMYLNNEVSVESKADIRHSGNNGYAIGNSGIGTLTISSGTLSALSNNTVYNFSTGTVNITGGTLYTMAGVSGNAVRNNNADGSIVLGGSPDIIGKISLAGTENLSVASFNPGTKTYKLDFPSASNNMIAVKDGATYLSNFSIVNPNTGADFSLSASGSDIILKVNGFSVSASGNSYTIAKGTGGYGNIQQAIDYIKTEAGGNDCSILFGNGTSELDIGASSILFNGGSGTDWGKVTLLGKIETSSAIQLIGGVSVESRADIKGYILNNGTGTLTINGGTISTQSVNGIAVYGYNGNTILSGSPNITGKIYMMDAGNLTVASFNPGTKTYELYFASPSNNKAAVKDGAPYLSNFTVGSFENSGVANLSLAASGNDIILSVVNGGYSVSANGSIYTITKGSGTYATIQQAIDYIKAQAGGSDCSIQFGNGTDELDIGTSYVQLNGGTSGTDWGKITLLGKITGATSYVILISNGVSIDSKADIKGNNTVYAIYNSGTGTLSITDGTISTASVTGAVNYAVLSTSGNVVLSGSPNITSQIYTAAGKLSVSEFNPGTKTYELYLGSPSSGAIVVKNGAAFASNFSVTGWNIGTSGNDLVLTTSSATTVAEKPFIITPVAAPTLNAKTGNTITINAVTPINDQEVEYAVSTTYAAPITGTWQTDLTFTGLMAHTTYYIFARAKENATYNYGMASEALVVKTDDEVDIAPITCPEGQELNENGECEIPTTPIISAKPATGGIIAQAIGKDIVLSNLPQNAKVEVFGLNGKRVGALPATPINGALRITVQTKGVYIVKVGTQTLRVAVK